MQSWEPAAPKTSLLNLLGGLDYTPIANIKMYSEFFKEDSLTTEERRHFADNLERQARKLSWLGEGFAKVSRLETGIISLKPEREEFARVFQRFYRGRNAEEQEGVGLGLYLAREIVNGQRGYMKGEYELEKGNVFSVFLRR